jgi:hypothetical protein
MLASVRSFAQRHPSWFSGGWFAVSALLLVSPLGTMILVFLGLEALAGRQAGGYVWMIFASVGLPLLPSFAMGALFGPRILRLPPGKRFLAAGWGAAAALGALVLWFLLLEGIPRLVVGRVQATGGGGDVPGAALVVGYLVFVPLIVALPLLAGATAGVLLREFAGHSKPTDHASNGTVERVRGDND